MSKNTKSSDDLAEENKILRSRVIVLESECDLLSKHCFKYQKEIERLNKINKWRNQSKQTRTKVPEVSRVVNAVTGEGQELMLDKWIKEEGEQ